MFKKTNKRSFRIMSLVCFVFASTSTNIVHSQDIYKKINADGSVTFSDKPFDGASQVNLDTNNNTIITSNSSPLATPQAMAQAKQKIPVLTIESPAHQATIRNNAGKVNIKASIQPKSAGRYLLRLRDRTLESTSGSFSLSELDRGTYPYQINFVDNTGKVIASSPTQRFYLHKNSIIKKPLIQSKP